MLYIFYLKDIFTFLEIWIEIRLTIREFTLDIGLFITVIFALLYLTRFLTELIFHYRIPEFILSFQFLFAFVAYAVTWTFKKMSFEYE